MPTPKIHHFDDIKRRMEEIREAENPSQSSSESPPIRLPPGFDILAAENALIDHRVLIDAFGWGSSMEGFEYWDKVWGDGHTSESRKKLKAYIDEWHRKNS